MSNLIGVQTQWDSVEMLRWLEIVGSRWCMGINVSKREYLEKVKARGTKYVYRHHPNFDEIGLVPWFVDPELAAQEAVAFLRGHLGALDLVDYVTDGNEYILGPDHETPERIVLADRYMAAFIKTARLFLSKGTIVGNFNTGHWRKEGELVEYFPLMLQALQKDCEANPEDSAKIGWHEYNWPLLRDDGYWRTATFLRAMPAIVEQYPLARCLITELGIDRCADEFGVPHEGFRKADPGIDVAIDMFCGSDGLAWYVDRLLEAPYVDGVLLFGCGMTDWRGMGFDVMNDPEDTAVPDRIGYLPDAAPPEPPDIPIGGDNVIPDSVRIYDFDHGPHADDPTTSKEWLDSIFGPCIDVHPVNEIHQLQPGDLYYQLQWINCKPATTSVIIELRDEGDQPVVGDTVIFRWPDAEPHGYDDQGWNWSDNGAPGDTDENGIVGPVITDDAYYSPDQGECGAFSLWIWDHPSEMVDGVGMLPFHDLAPGLNHLHTEFGFKLARYGEEPEPPDPGEPGEALEIIASIRAQLDQLEAILSALDARTEALAAELSALI